MKRLRFFFKCLPSRIAFNKSFLVSSTGGRTFFATFFFGVIKPLFKSPFAIGLNKDGGLCGPSNGGGGGGGGGAAFGGDCFDNNYKTNLINF